VVQGGVLGDGSRRGLFLGLVGRFCRVVGVGALVVDRFARRIGVVREQRRHREHAQRDWLLGGEQSEHLECEHPERDRAPEAEAVDVDGAPELRRRERDAEGEGDAGAGGRGRGEQRRGLGADLQSGVGRLEAGDEPETDDDPGAGEILPDLRAGGLGGDSEDHQPGEAVEHLEAEHRAQRLGERRLDDGDGDEDEPQQQHGGGFLPGGALHLREDDGDGRGAAEDE